MISLVFIVIFLIFPCCCLSFLFTLYCISDQATFFLFFMFLFHLFYSHSVSCLMFQPSFPPSLDLLFFFLNLSSPCSSSSSISSYFYNFSLFLLFYYFSCPFFLFFFLLSPLLLFLFISKLNQHDDFLNFSCHFLGVVLPAPTLYPSLMLVSVII